jgi:hypothetical protein
MTTENNIIDADTLEEGLRQRNPSALTPTGRAKSTMSVTSKMYDVDGDGKLDAVEKSMRQMDTENRGYLTNEKVYKIMLEQMKLQEEVFGLKRMALVFLAIVFILSLATLGTSFAAAMLAKDTKLENGNLVSKDGSSVVGTSNVAATFTVTEGATPVDASGRRTQEGIAYNETGSTITITRSDAATAHVDCAKAGGYVFLERECNEGTLMVEIPLCSGTTILAVDESGPMYTFTTAQKETTIDCSDASADTEPCEVTFPIETGIDTLGCPLIPKVDLGSAGNYVILAKTGISTVPNSVITGDIAVSPISAAALTGFGLTADSTTTFSTSTQVVGKAYAATYAVPTPSDLTTAVGAMETAYTDAAGRPAGVGPKLNFNGGILNEHVFTPGIHTFTTAVSMTGDIHFQGSATDIFIIQIASTLTQAANYNVILDTTWAGTPLAKNIFWQTAGAVTVGANAHMEGVLLVKTAVTFVTGSSLNGRILAQTACVLQTATITQPAN